LWDLLVTAVGQHFGMQSERGLIWRWILACGVSTPLAILYLWVERFGFRLIQRTLHLLSWYQNGRNPVLFSAIIAGGVGLFLGLLQAAALGWKWPYRLLWVAATMIGVATGWTAMLRLFMGNYLWTSIVANRQYIHPIGFLWCGAIIGLVQSFVLATKTTRSLAWIPACAIAMAGLGWIADHSPTELIPALSGGLVFGILTAVPLNWIVSPTLTVFPSDLSKTES
jgi:hypothetical protein